MLDAFYYAAEIVAIFVLAVDLLTIHATIYVMRRNHPDEVYVIWYVCSFFFILFLGITLIASSNNIAIAEVCGAQKDVCKSIYEMLTDIKGEAVFLGVIVGLALGPQLLTYLVSGVFGTAAAPRFVRHIQAIAVWSLIKFLAGFGGIVMAQSLAVHIAGTTGDIPRMGVGAIFVVGVTFVAAAFLIAAIYTVLTDAWDSFLKRHQVPTALMAIHKWCTRHVPAKPPYSLTRTALIELLKSDAVYDYMTQNRENR